MSLLSQKDRKNVIESLNFYLVNKGRDLPKEKVSELNALINWIRLEYYKQKFKEE